MPVDPPRDEGEAHPGRCLSVGDKLEACAKHRFDLLGEVVDEARHVVKAARPDPELVGEAGGARLVVGNKFDHDIPPLAVCRRVVEQCRPALVGHG